MTDTSKHSIDSPSETAKEKRVMRCNGDAVGDLMDDFKDTLEEKNLGASFLLTVLLASSGWTVEMIRAVVLLFFKNESTKPELDFDKILAADGYKLVKIED